MDKAHQAIERIQTASKLSLEKYGLPLVVTTSGGKDSSVCLSLAQRAGIPFEVLHNHTTADAPETVYFIRDEFYHLELKGVKCCISHPIYMGKRTSMWQLIPQKLMPPTRAVRYCCEILKEHGGNGRFITTGVRWAESKKRKNRGIYEIPHKDKTKRVFINNDNDDCRRLFETCTIKAKRTCNPIIDWTDAEVWDYIHSERITINPLYSCGFDRVGCIGCPMAPKARWKEFRRYPKYRDMYVRSFDMMIAERKRRGLLCGWEDGEEVFGWWTEDGVLPGQIKMEGVDGRYDNKRSDSGFDLV